MAQLLFTVLAIALLAVAATAGVSYINFDTARSQLTAQMASTGFAAWEQAFTTYRVVNRAQPHDLDELNSYLAGPRRTAGMPQPKAPAGFAWSYGTDTSGAFICLSGYSDSTIDYEGLARIGASSSKASTLPADAVSTGPACGSSGGSAVGQRMAVTYRLTF